MKITLDIKSDKLKSLEAAYHLTKELREKTEDRIEWRKIMAFRHILVHDY